MESPHAGTFKRFSNTEVLILSVDITEEQYADLENRLAAMWNQRKKYRYNVAGLCLAYFHIEWKRTNCFYCSEFVGEILIKGRVVGVENLHSSIIQPIDFLQLPHTQLYCGKLSEYTYKDCTDTVDNKESTRP